MTAHNIAANKFPQTGASGRFKNLLASCLLGLIFVLPIAAAPGVPEFQWAQRGGGANADHGYAVAVDAAGNSYVTGTFDGAVSFGPTNLTGVVEIFVAKYNASGALQWVRKFGGPNRDEGKAIAVDSAGNCYVTGFFTGTVDFGGTNLTSAGGADIFVAKYNTDGALQWARRGGSSVNDEETGRGIAVDSAGNCYVTGYFTGSANFTGVSATSAGGYDFFLIKYNSAGTIQWLRTVGEFASDRGHAVAVDSSGNCYVTGHYENTINFGGTSLTRVGINDIFVVKYNTSGTVLWARSAGGSDFDEGFGIAADLAGNCYVTGYFTRNATFGSTTLTNADDHADIFLAKYNNTGVMQWSRRLGVPQNDYGRGVVVDGLGNSFITGSLTGKPFVAKHTSAGDLHWIQAPEGTVFGEGFGIALMSTITNCYVSGLYYGTVTFGLHTLTNSGQADFFFTKLALFNHQPSFTKGADQTVLEDAVALSVTNWATNISPGSTDETGQLLTFFTTNDNSSLFLSPPAISSSGTLTYTLAPNANGVATVGVWLKDNGGTFNGGADTSAVENFTITVIPVNDLPVAGAQSVSVFEDTPLNITLTGIDVDGDPLTFTVTTLPMHGTLSGVPPVLSYLAQTNYFGPDSFSFRVNDGHGDSAEAEISIAVGPINDVPEADASATLPLHISPNGTNATVVLDGTRSWDADGDALQYRWFVSGTTNTLGSGVVAVVILPVGTNSISLVVSDGTISATNTVTIEVITTAQAVERLVSIVDAEISRSRPLIASLNAAISSIDRSNPTAALNQLRAFQNKVMAQVTPLDVALAAEFIRLAQEVIDVLNGGSAGSASVNGVATNSRRVTRQSNGKVLVQFSAKAGSIQIVAASTNVIDWELIGVAVDRGGEFEFEDKNAERFPARYYRIISP